MRCFKRYRLRKSPQTVVVFKPRAAEIFDARSVVLVLI